LKQFLLSSASDNLPTTVYLDDTNLQWTQGKAGQEMQFNSIPLKDLVMVRLNPPVTIYRTDGHYLCSLYSTAGKVVAFRSNIDDESMIEAYGGFLKELHGGLQGQTHPMKFQSGLMSPLLFWIISTAMVFMWGIMAVVVYFGMERKQEYLFPILVFSGVTAFIFAFIRFAQKILVPRPYNPTEIPKNLSPMS
jgi:hypothetical protein